MHSSNNIEKLQYHCNQFFESEPVCNSLRSIQESSLLAVRNNEIATDNETTCNPENFCESPFTDFRNTICKKETEDLDDGRKASEEVSSQMFNPLSIIANEYYNLPSTSSGTNVDISSTTNFSTPCNTDFVSSSNVNCSATSTSVFSPLSNANFVLSSSANFDQPFYINFGASSSTNFVPTTGANFCTPSNTNLDYGQNYNLATQTNSIYGQASSTEKQAETYQMGGEDRQPSSISPELEMQDTTQSNTKGKMGLLSGVDLDSIYKQIESTKEKEKYCNITNATENLYSSTLANFNLVNNVEKNEEMQIGIQGLINPSDIKSEANGQPSESENMTDAMNEIFLGNSEFMKSDFIKSEFIKKEPEEYKQVETEDYKIPLKIRISKDKENWSSSLSHGPGLPGPSNNGITEVSNTAVKQNGVYKSPPLPKGYSHVISEGNEKTYHVQNNWSIKKEKK